MDWWDPINGFTGITATVKAPTFDIINTMKLIEEGGMNANWVSASEGWHCINSIDTNPSNPLGALGLRLGLNPKYDMDFIGFQKSYY